MFIVWSYFDRLFVHLRGLVVVLQEEVSSAQVRVGRRVRSNGEGFVELRNSLSPLTLSHIHHTEAFITYGIVAGDFDHLLKLRQRLGVVAEPKVAVAQGGVIRPIIRVGGDGFLVGGDRILTLTAAPVGLSQTYHLFSPAQLPGSGADAVVEREVIRGR